MHQEILTKILQDNGYSLTRPRLLIFNILLENDPLAMKDLTAKSAKQTDRATIYRTVELFEKLNISQRLNIGWKYKIELSDKFKSHHHHLHCNACGQMLDIAEDEPLEAMIEKIALRNGFRAKGHQLEIDGLCKNCALKS